MPDRTALDRRQFVRMSGMGLAGLAASWPWLAPGAAAARPNILLFLVDDLGWQDPSEPFDVRRSPLNDRYRTPNLERPGGGRQVHAAPTRRCRLLAHPRQPHDRPEPRPPPRHQLDAPQKNAIKSGERKHPSLALPSGT